MAEWKERTCPVTKKKCGWLSECKIELKDLPGECLDKFEMAFRFYKV